MFCQQCGTENRDTAKFCVKCGSGMAPAGHRQSPFTQSVTASSPAQPPSIAANTSGTRSSVPREVSGMGWCWGAFGMPFLWAAANKVWWVLPVWVVGMVLGLSGSALSLLSLLCMLVLIVFLGVRGHEMAWRARRFESLQQFRDTMKVWRAWGIVMAVLAIPASVAGAIAGLIG